jgi:hypothetical protein
MIRLEFLAKHLLVGCQHAKEGQTNLVKEGIAVC